jgi:hypothetical protein
MTCGALKHPEPFLKIARNSVGDLMSGAGYAHQISALLRWFLDGENDPFPFTKDEKDESEIVIIRATGEIEEIYANKSKMTTRTGDVALGCFYYLHGAMDHGASAVEAVMLGCEHLNTSGFPIVSVGHSGPPCIWRNKLEIEPLSSVSQSLKVQLDAMIK